MDMEWMDEDTYKEWAASVRHGDRFEMRTRHTRSYVCLTFIMTLLIVFIILFIATSGVFYWYLFEYRESSPFSSTFIEIPITLEIDKEYLVEYDDITSQEYNNFTSGFVKEIEKVLSNSSIGGIYIYTYVTSLRPGSVIVDSASIFENKPVHNGTYTLQDRLDHLRNVVEMLMSATSSDGLLGDSIPLVPDSSIILGTPIVIDELPKLKQTLVKTTLMIETTQGIGTTSEAVMTPNTTVYSSHGSTLVPSSTESPNHSDPFHTGICGSTIPSQRILGGQESPLGSMPWVGSVRTSSRAHYCGAALISDRWAITAAHCIIYADHLTFGSTSLDNPSDFTENIPISAMFPHPGYSLTSKHPDVALIRLSRSVKISAAIRPVCLANVIRNVEEVDVYANCKAVGHVGWGTSDESGGLSPLLKEVNIPLLPRSDCTEMTSSDNASQWRICAGNVPGVDTCTGDNGSPLVCRGEHGLWHIVGVTTRSSACMTADIDVYTRISALRNFIVDTIAHVEDCIDTALESDCLSECVGGLDCNNQCNEGEVQCSIGNCINMSKACDRTADCIDASDEGSSQSCRSEGCGGQILIEPNSNPATIQSPGYPGTYQSFQRCQWSITATVGSRVRLRFIEFNLERRFDTLQISDSSNTALLTLSGEAIPLDVISTEAIVTLMFESDYALELNGFQLEAMSVSENEIGTLNTCSNGLQVVPDPQMRNIMCNGVSECADHADEIPCACGDTVHNLQTNETALIQSQDFDNGGYPYDPVPCQWVVTASSPERRLRVTFIEFKTESGYDFLTIATGLRDNSTRVSYSGHNIPLDVVSSGSRLFIKFTGDESGGARGLQFQVSDISAQTITGMMKCHNGIEVLQPDHICDGVNHCSDGSDEHALSCMCGRITLFLITPGNSTEFTSPRYPANYPNSASCQYLALVQEPMHRIRVHFSEFSLEEGFDFLQIGNMTFTGSQLPSDIVSPDNQLSIEFRTDYSISSGGFSITFYGEADEV